LPASLSLSSSPSASAIPRLVWQRLCPAGDPFLNADYLTILETHGAAAAGAGWTPCHLLATAANGEVVGLLPPGCCRCTASIIRTATSSTIGRGPRPGVSSAVRTIRS